MLFIILQSNAVHDAVQIRTIAKQAMRAGALDGRMTRKTIAAKLATEAAATRSLVTMQRTLTLLMSTIITTTHTIVRWAPVLGAKNGRWPRRHGVARRTSEDAHNATTLEVTLHTTARQKKYPILPQSSMHALQVVALLHC